MKNEVHTLNSNDSGIIYIVATPIGNMEDVTFRAIRILGEVDFVACEDTRTTKKLLNHYNINTKTISYHQHSGLQKIEKIVQDVLGGKSVAVVTDAGTPGISDPGNLLVNNAIKEGIKVVSVPGASALSSIISVSGIDMQKFVFLAFPPHKKGRNKFFQELLDYKYPVVYYDSPYRVLKNLEIFRKLGGDNKQIIVGRELTKMFEEVIRGNIKEVIQYFSDNKDKVRGEFSLIVY